MQISKARLACILGTAIFCAAVDAADTPNLSEAERARIEYVQKALKGEPSPVPGRRMIGSGTGFFVAPQRVLTAYHVIERCAAITIRGNDGATVTVKRIADEKQNDLALVGTETVAVAVATFRPTETTRAGEPVATVGYPMQGLPRIEPFLTGGAVAAISHPEAASRLVIRADVRPGNSGGPVLDDHGQVVGLVSAKINTVQVYKRTGKDIQNVGFAIATGPVLEFLKRSGIEPSRAETSAMLGIGEELLGNARQFIVRVGCWQ